MATIAYAGVPAHGHTNPSMAVAKELVARGHHVLYYNAEAFRQKVAPTGVDFRAYPEPVPSERDIAEAMHDIVKGFVMVYSVAERLTHHLIGELTREQPDLVIYDSLAMWGYVAARTQAIPQVCFSTTFLSGTLQGVGIGDSARLWWSLLLHLPTLLRARRHMARTFGATNVGRVTEYADVNIVFTSVEFHPPNKLIDERFHFVGPALDATTRVDGLDLERSTTRALVYISLGTISDPRTAFFDTVFDAFANHPSHFVMSVGKYKDPTSLGTLPGNFTVRQSVPQLEVLQRAVAFITHGGLNSVHEGLCYGVPLIVVPRQIEQLVNGKRVARMGAGILLGHTRPYGRVTAPELREALDALLATPSYAERARQIGETLRRAGGYERAADIIEAASTRPTSVHDSHV